MKLEKREITLNEFDSLKETFYMEKMLVNEYLECLTKAARKETRKELLQLMQEVGEELSLAQDLMKKSATEEE